MLLKTLHKVDPFTHIPVSPKHTAGHCPLTAARILWVQNFQKNMLSCSDWALKETGCTKLIESHSLIQFIPSPPAQKSHFKSYIPAGTGDRGQDHHSSSGLPTLASLEFGGGSIQETLQTQGIQSIVNVGQESHTVWVKKYQNSQSKNVSISLVGI